GALHRAPGENVGSYPIDQGALTAGSNYSIAFTNGVPFAIVYAASGTCYGAPGHAVLQPINTDGSSVFKSGSTVPVKFRVCDANGNSVGPVGSTSVATTLSLVKVAPDNSQVNETVISTTPDTAFRWDATNQQWIFNLSTKNLGGNAKYVGNIPLNDG